MTIKPQSSGAEALTTSLGDSSHETDFSYDGSDRNVSITSGNN